MRRLLAIAILGNSREDFSEKLRKLERNKRKRFWSRSSGNQIINTPNSQRVFLLGVFFCFIKLVHNYYGKTRPTN